MASGVVCLMEAWFRKFWVWYMDWYRKLVQNYSEFRGTVVVSLMRVLAVRGSIVVGMSTELSTSAVIVTEPDPLIS